MTTSNLTDNRNLLALELGKTFFRVLRKDQRVAIAAMQDHMHKVAWTQCTLMVT